MADGAPPRAPASDGRRPGAGVARAAAGAGSGRPPGLRGLAQRLQGLLAPQVASAARERRDILVLLLAVALVALPHVEHLPVWASAAFAATWAWRLQLTLRRRDLPGRRLLLPLLVATVIAVSLQHGTLVGRDAGVTFLLLLLGLKLLEMRARRDVFVVVFLAFFVLLTEFLFSQALPVLLAVLAAVVGLFFVLVSVHLADGDLTAGRKLRLVLGLMVRALPLTLALFLLFPRLQGPLWGLPGEGGATSGLSDSMSPGSISQLLESDAIAFRVRFDGEAPPRQDLYWRGPVFAAFNGRTWSPMDGADDRAQAMPEIQVEPASVITYTVTLEPHRRRWLFGLELALLPSRDDGVPLPARLTPELVLESASPVDERFRYTVRSFLQFRVGSPPDARPPADPAARREAAWGDGGRPALAPWRALPAGSNPRTLQWAADLRHQVVPDGTPPAQADLLLTRAVLEHFHRGGFAYTLSPPTLGRDSVDEFLFDTRRGFCEHYASAFVFMMRALGLPARVVTGYQGGEVHPVDGYLTVRQSDAHAWAEVWITQRGWVRIDPTATVSPDRIEQGAAELARREGLLPLTERIAPLAWLRSLRLNWEALDNLWGQWVLSYSSDRQRALLQRVGLQPTAEHLLWLFTGTATALLMLLGLWTLRHRSVQDPLARIDRMVRARLRAAGIAAGDSDGPRTLAARVRGRLVPTAEAEALSLLDWLERARYGRPGTGTTPDINPAALRAALWRARRWRPAPRRD